MNLNLYSITLPPGLATIMLGIGIFISLGVIAVTKGSVSPGGLVVPGWFALTAMESPATLGVTTAAILATIAAAVGIDRFAIVYGKRLFALTVGIGILFEMTAYVLLEKGHPDLFPTSTLGFVVPGLFAYQLIRARRKVRTAVATLAVALATCAVITIGLVV